MPAFIDPFFSPLTSAGPSPSETSGRLRARCGSVLQDALNHGTACFDLKSGLEASDRLQSNAVRTFRALRSGPWDLRTTYCARPETTIDRVTRVVRRRLAVALEVSPWMRELTRQAVAARVPLKMYAPIGEGAPAVRQALECGAMTVDGIGEIGPLEIRSLSLSHTITVLLPACGARPEVARRLLDSGAAVALASGFGYQVPATYSQQAAIELACSRLGFSIEEALTAATVNAAWAAGAAWERGTIEPGKIADLIILNCADVQEFTHNLGVNRVALVIKSGSVVKEPGGDAWKTWS